MVKGYELKILNDLPDLSDGWNAVTAEVDIKGVKHKTEFYKFTTKYLKNLLAYASKRNDRVEIALAPYRKDNCALCLVRDTKDGKIYALAGWVNPGKPKRVRY